MNIQTEPMDKEMRFEDYRNRLDIKDVLMDAGYTLNKRDGMRYPSFVRMDSGGRRIRGDKFLVTPKGNCCFQPPTFKLYSVTSFIWEHPELFAEYRQDMKKSDLVHNVCRRLLSFPAERLDRQMLEPAMEVRPFDIKDYRIERFHPDDFESQKPFHAFFKSRGIDQATRCAFHQSFLLASKASKDGTVYKNLSFPMRIPGQPDKCVGFEERGYPRMDGTARKGMAAGTNAGQGLWIASPGGVALKDARRVFVFESAYDAMAFYQLRMGKETGLDVQGRQDLANAVYVSTSGNPSYGQMEGLVKAAPQAVFHLGFDNDQAGRQFVHNFESIARKSSPIAPDNVPSDMVAFINSFTEPPRTTRGLASIDDDQYYELPRDLRDIYLEYDTARDEAYEYYYSPFLCKEDKQEAVGKMREAFSVFKSALLERLHLQDGQELHPIKTVREEPSQDYKDFNDELLDRKRHFSMGVTDTSIDGNVGPLTVGGQEENGETGQNRFKR